MVVFSDESANKHWRRQAQITRSRSWLTYGRNTTLRQLRIWNSWT